LKCVPALLRGVAAAAPSNTAPSPTYLYRQLTAEQSARSKNVGQSWRHLTPSCVMRPLAHVGRAECFRVALDPRPSGPPAPVRASGAAPEWAVSRQMRDSPSRRR
jgi:hypothetical protein